jgi:UDP-3-O-[3-hydroxymyristoyl] glucosamine N-acyltransferase LpxD
MNKHFNNITLRNLGFPFDFEIFRICSLLNPKENSVMFVKKKKNNKYSNLKEVKNCLIFIDNDLTSEIVKFIDKGLNEVIFCDNPRLEFIIFLNDKIMPNQNNEPLKLKNGSFIHDSFIFNDTVIIESGCTIEANVTIGSGTIIRSGSRILKNTTIGNNCIVDYNTIIGGDGFGLERFDQKIIKMPHFGGVIIEDNVSVGANCTIRSGGMDSTFIGENTVIDDSCVIAHNCIVGKSSIICGCSSLGGSVVLGEKVWIGSGSTIIQNITIEKNCTVGLGSVVRKKLKQGEKVLGNPAVSTLEYAKRESKIKYL